MSVITLSALYQFPIKSCAGKQTSQLIIGPRGPEDDRMFMVTNPQYVFLTQRKENGGLPRMAFIGSRISRGNEQLSLFDLRSVVTPCQFDVKSQGTPIKAQVHDDVCDALDQGDVPAGWLTEFLGVPCRLVRMVNTYYRQVDRVFSPKPAQVSFADDFPLLLISDASLEDLNERLKARGKLPVDRLSFRANFWVSGCRAYEEDTWSRIRINGVEFDVVKSCRRCSVTQVDRGTGEYRPDHEPLPTLQMYRHQTIPETGKKGVMFGRNMVHRGTGAVYVGNTVEVI